MAEGEGFREVREDMERAIRRLNVLEYVIMVAAVLLALAGGGFVALLLSSGTDLPLRPTWAALSLLLIIVPAVVVFARERTGKRGDGTGRGGGPVPPDGPGAEPDGEGASPDAGSRG